MRICLSTASVLILCGCSSVPVAFWNRPVVEDNIHDTVSTVSLASDRRTVVVRTTGDKKGTFCAEPPPDSATSLATQLDANASAKREGVGEVSGAFKDRAATAVSVLAERTPALDGFRVALYSLCQFHLNGAIKPEDVKELFNSLMKNFAENVKAEALRPPRPIVVTNAGADPASMINKGVAASAGNAVNSGVKKPEGPAENWAPLVEN